MLRLHGHKMICETTNKARRITMIGECPKTEKYVIWSNLSDCQIKHRVTDDYDEAYRVYQLWMKRAEEPGYRLEKIEF